MLPNDCPDVSWGTSAGGLTDPGWVGTFTGGTVATGADAGAGAGAGKENPEDNGLPKTKGVSELTGNATVAPLLADAVWVGGFT